MRGLNGFGTGMSAGARGNSISSREKQASFCRFTGSAEGYLFGGLFFLILLLHSVQLSAGNFSSEVLPGSSVISGIESHVEYNGGTGDLSNPLSPYSAPVIEYPEPRASNTAYDVSRTISGIRIYSATVPVTGSFVPRMYYKNYDAISAWTSTPGTLVSGTENDGIWSFTITYAEAGGVNNGQRVAYYIVAQSEGGAVTVLPSAGANHSDVLTQVSAPTSPFTFFKRQLFNKTVVKVGGTGADYPSLTGSTGLFQAINSSVFRNNLIVQIGADLNLALTNPVSTRQITEFSREDHEPYTITITTDGNARLITNSITNLPVLDIKVPRIIIDGTPSKLLTIRHYTTSGQYFPLLIGSTASYDTIRNCILEGGSVTTVNVGVVTFDTSSGRKPSNIVIENCDIKNYGTSYPGKGIFIKGGSNITITNNNFYNYDSTGISLSVSSTDTINILGNSFFRTINATKALNGIVATGPADFVPNIIGNYFGGQNVQAGGSAMNMATFNYTAITVLSGNIQGNVISNITHTSTTTSTFTGIKTTAGTGATVNIGGVAGNVIGHPTATNSIANVRNFYAIDGSATTGTLKIENNTIANINRQGAGTFTVITGNGSGTIKNNTISVINTPSGATFTGITSSAGGVIDSNVISSVSMSGTGTFNGIIGRTIRKNQIYSISTSTTTTPVLNVITGSGDDAIEENSIHSISLVSTANFTGINGRYVRRNRIYSINTGSVGAPVITGIKAPDDVAKEISNNMISLKNSTGVTAAIRGILCSKHTVSANPFNIYHNSILITGVQNNSLKYVLEITGTTANYASIFNNIFSNRITAASGTYPSGIYKFGSATTLTGIALDYNQTYAATTTYYASLGSTHKTFAAFSDGTYKYSGNMNQEGNSLLQDVAFQSLTNLELVSDTGYTTSVITGLTNTLVTTDINGDTRFDPPVVGCHENVPERTITSSGTLPSSGNIGGLNLNLNNGTASLGGNTVLTGPLVLTSGTLSIGNFTLTLYKGLTYSGGSITGGAGSNLVYSHPNATDTAVLPPITGGLGKMKVSHSVGVKLSASLTVYDTLEFNTGTLDIGSNTLNIQGAVKRGIGKMKAGPGAKLNITSNLPVSLPPVEGGVKTIDISGGAQVTLGSDVVIYDTLKVTSGTLALGANKLSIKSKFISPAPVLGGSGASVEFDGVPEGITSLPVITNGLKTLKVNSSSAVVQLSDSLTIHDTLDLASGNLDLNGKKLIQKGAFKAGAGKIIGGTSHSIALQGTRTDTTSLPVIENGLSEITLSRAGAVALSSSTHIYNTVVIDSGKILTGNNTLTLGADATLTGERAGNYVIGNIQTTRNTGTSSSAFGGIGVTLSAGDDNLGTVTVVRRSGPDAKITVGESSGINRSWSIEAENQPSAGRELQLSWVKDDDSTSASVNVWRSTNNGTSWQKHSGPYFPGSGDIRSVTVSTTHFSDWTISNEDNPMPVELVSFSVRRMQNSVVLNWKTATEVSNYGFEIERTLKQNSTEIPSADAWKKIAFTAGSGNSNSPKEYSYTDKVASSGIYCYRLKQIDTDGSFSYSEQIEVKVSMIPEEYFLEQNYPNPFNPETTIRFGLPENTLTRLEIFDITGSSVALLLNEMKEAGYYSIPFGSGKLSSGVYFLRISAGKFISVKKMNVVK